MNDNDHDQLGELRVDVARLTQDLSHLQQDVAEIRLIFERLAWLAIAAVGAAFLSFLIEGGFAGAAITP